MPVEKGRIDRNKVNKTVIEWDGQDSNGMDTGPEWDEQEWSEMDRNSGGGY